MIHRATSRREIGVIVVCVSLGWGVAFVRSILHRHELYPLTIWEMFARPARPRVVKFELHVRESPTSEVRRLRAELLTSTEQEVHPAVAASFLQHLVDGSRGSEPPSTASGTREPPAEVARMWTEIATERLALPKLPHSLSLVRATYSFPNPSGLELREPELETCFQFSPRRLP